MRQFDVAIVGGGPAGCAAALTLAVYSKLSVVLIERDDEADKPGEFIPSSLMPLLDYLGIGSEALASCRRETHRLLASWGGDALRERSFLFSGSGHAFQIDRRCFEQILKEQARARGVVFESASLRRAARTQQAWRLRLECPDAYSELEARFFVDASGRSARVAREQCAARHQGDRLTAAWRMIELRPEGDTLGDGATMIEAVEDGWWYTARLPGERAVAAFFTDADLLQQGRLYRDDGWHAVLAASDYTCARLVDASALGPIVVRAANAQRLDRSHGADWIACGDAALAVDPISAAGIGLALLTGAHAGRVAAAASAGENVSNCGYSAEIARLYDEHRGLCQSFYEAETRWQAAPFWSRRQRASNRATIGVLEAV